MMRSRTWRKCQEFTETLTKAGYERISFRDLRYNIKIFIGSDDRTIKKYLRLIGEFGFVTPVHGRPNLFNVNEDPTKPLRRYFPKMFQQTLMNVDDDEPP